MFAFKETNDNEYSAYHLEQIHILESEKDLEGFRKFKENKNKRQE